MSGYDIFHKRYSCSCCSGKVVVRGINDISTTDYWMVKYFIFGEEEASLYTANSSCKLYFKCPFCGKIQDKPISIGQLKSNKKLMCDCSDKISYPEKFFREIFNDKSIEYIYQTNNNILHWSKSYKYDFYLPKYNLIIETHGEQHYKENNFFKKTLDSQKKTDKEKKNLALQNGISHYFEIDCSKSDKEYIINSINNSGLLEILKIDISENEYSKYDECSHKNIVKEVCSFYSKNNISTPEELSPLFKLHKSTIYKYLLIGNKYDWCNYNPKNNLVNGALKTNEIRTNKKHKYYGDIIVFNENDLEICRGKSFYEVKRKLNNLNIDISVPSIGNALKKSTHKSKNLYFYYQKDLKNKSSEVI